MNEISFPLQPIRTLVIASVLAILVAVIVFVIAILPAEYNIDPTGLGQKMGLTQLAQTAEPAKPKAPEVAGYQRDEITIEIPAHGELEYKFFLPASGKLAYEWRTAGNKIYSDFHGEPEGDQTGYYESYAITTTNEASGLVTVPYAGSHGWYWKNESDEAISINLTTSGAYQVIGIK